MLLIHSPLNVQPNANQVSHSNLLRLKGIKVLVDTVKCGESCIVMPPRTLFSCRFFAPKHLWYLTVRAKVSKARGIVTYYILGNTVLQK